ncbi:MAG: hypothetical protein ACRCU6_08300 [Fusobacteriaceae bacterium]
MEKIGNFFKNILLILAPAYFAFYLGKLFVTGGSDYSFYLNPLEIIDQFILLLTVKYTGNYSASYFLGILFFILPSYISLFLKLTLSKKLKKK